MNKDFETDKAKPIQKPFRDLFSVKDNVFSLEEFKHLYLEWSQPIYRYVLSRVHNQAEAEDITSQVFVAAFEKFGVYQEEGRFLGWLFRITKNKIIDHYRRNKNIQDVDLKDVELISHNGRASQEHFIDLLSAIGKLPQADQDLLRLRYAAELSFQEVGLFLGKKEDATRKAHQRIVKQLKNLLEE